MRFKRLLATAALAAGLLTVGGVAAQSAEAVGPKPSALEVLCEAKGGHYFTGRFGEPRCQGTRSFFGGAFFAERLVCEHFLGLTFHADPMINVPGRYAWICS